MFVRHGRGAALVCVRQFGFQYGGLDVRGQLSLADLLSAVARAGGQAAGLLVINPPYGFQVAAGRAALIAPPLKPPSGLAETAGLI
jgi:hypothetical protein